VKIESIVRPARASATAAAVINAQIAAVMKAASGVISTPTTQDRVTIARAVVAAASHLGEVPKVQDLVGAITAMTDAYRQGKIDRLYLVHSVFVNTMSQVPTVSQILPVEAVDKDSLQQHWDYIYEPDAVSLLDGVLDRYIESQVYRGAVENVACEMASKMVAMKAATDNAGKFIEGLQLQYNKARQAAITREIAEIVGGAAAV